MVTACTIAKLANKYALEYTGTLVTDMDCEKIRQEVALQLGVSPDDVRVFGLNPQSPVMCDETAWPVNAKSLNVTSDYESIIPRPELLGTPGRTIPGCPSQAASSALRISSTTGLTTYYGAGQVKDSTNCSLQQVLKIAVVSN
jgi:hypothetical protein